MFIIIYRLKTQQLVSAAFGRHLVFEFEPDYGRMRPELAALSLTF
jgi:hypothetical protein